MEGYASDLRQEDHAVKQKMPTNSSLCISKSNQHVGLLSSRLSSQWKANESNGSGSIKTP